MPKIEGWDYEGSDKRVNGNNFEELWSSDKRFVGVQKRMGSYFVSQLKRGAHATGRIKGWIDTKEDARKAAVAWMRKHPNG